MMAAYLLRPPRGEAREPRWMQIYTSWVTWCLRNRVLTLLEDREGRLWVGTANGLCMFESPHGSQGCQRVSLGAGLGSVAVGALLLFTSGWYSVLYWFRKSIYGPPTMDFIAASI